MSRIFRPLERAIGAVAEALGEGIVDPGGSRENRGIATQVAENATGPSLDVGTAPES